MPILSAPPSRNSCRKVQAAGQGTVATIYISGYGMQMEGENYLIPPGAEVRRDTDLPLNGIRLADITQALASMPDNINIVMFDLAYQGPFAREGQPLAPGLCDHGSRQGHADRVQHAASRCRPASQGPYGPYAQALGEIMREAGLPLKDVFDASASAFPN